MNRRTREEGLPKSQNLGTVGHRVTAADRARASGHRGGILWFTGLPGSGKSTLAVELESALFARGFHAFLLDGDNVRQGLSADLGFSPEDREENIRRVGEVAGLFSDAGMIVICAFISPYRRDRDRIRAAHENEFCEIYINAPLEVCEARDPKGHYRRARAGEIRDFTGVSSPYEPPLAPDLEIPTSAWSVEHCVHQLTKFVESRLGVDLREASLESRP